MAFERRRFFVDDLAVGSVSVCVYVCLSVHLYVCLSVRPSVTLWY